MVDHGDWKISCCRVLRCLKFPVDWCVIGLVELLELLCTMSECVSEMSVSCNAVHEGSKVNWNMFRDRELVVFLCSLLDCEQGIEGTR